MGYLNEICGLYQCQHPKLLYCNFAKYWGKWRQLYKGSLYIISYKYMRIYNCFNKKCNQKTIKYVSIYSHSDTFQKRVSTIQMASIHRNATFPPWSSGSYKLSAGWYNTTLLPGWQIRKSLAVPCVGADADSTHSRTLLEGVWICTGTQ